jgi:ADP-heptose:LPS heptosyltransferase
MTPPPGPARAPEGRILVIRGGAVGDFILTLPVLRAIREKFPRHHLEVLGYPGIAGLAVHWNAADRVTALEHGGLARFFVPGAPLEPAWRTFFAGFDTIISFLYDPDGFFLENLRRAGARSLVIGPHKPSDDGPHAVLQLAAPLESIGMMCDPADRRPFQVRVGTPASDSPIAIHPGSGSPRKNWPIEKWREVCARRHAGHGDRFLLVSGEAECAWIDSFKSVLGAGGVSFEHVENPPLPELAGRLAECRMFIGHDSGISHLAAACGLRCVLAFGPTNPDVWAPWQKDVHVVRAPDGDLNRLDPAGFLERMRGL